MKRIVISWAVYIAKKLMHSDVINYVGIIFKRLWDQFLTEFTVILQKEFVDRVGVSWSYLQIQNEDPKAR